MPPMRRRHHTSNRSNATPPLIIFATFGALIFLFGIYSFFALPRDSTAHIHDRHSTSETGAEGVKGFSVPVNGGKTDNDLWRSRDSEFFYGCSNATSKFVNANVITRSNRFLLIATSGGLNQQRTGIIDGVVAARILNATLAIPKLDQRSYWKDASHFVDIFDVDWFISSLSPDVKIMKELPKGMKTYGMKVPRKCNQRCYEKRVLPPLMKRHAVQLNKYDYRLANKLDTDLQKLRCRVNYHALKFTGSIYGMGKALVERMRMKSEHYIALHLRFEPDMLAFSGCYYGGGDKERKELGAIRKRWKTLHGPNPDKQRRQGRCPLTPEEVGLMLRALGYSSDVHIYVASGDVYGGEDSLAPLKSLFPNFYSKDTIASKEELEPFSKYSSRMAALDFIVCDESDVFVTNNNGNMAKILAGRRRYLGHKPTIRPNAKKLYRVFASRENMTWEEFESQVRTRQRGFMGLPNEVRPGRGEFHENPAACICENAEARARKSSTTRKFGKDSTPVSKDEEEDSDDHPEEDMDFVEPDYDGFHDAGVSNQANATLTGDYDVPISEEPDLEDAVSD